jgi:hypothetical protein
VADTVGAVAGRRIDRRSLGRATLARQLLLERASVPVVGAVEHLVGLQAQTAQTWYVGLWGRLAGFRAEELSDLLDQRRVVRLALMRSTIHLVSARDCVVLRPLFGPVLERSMHGNFGKHLVGLDREEVSAAARAALVERPRIASELGRVLAQRWPDRDPASLAQAVRASEALVQVTPRGLWGRSGPAAHTTAEHWLGVELGPALPVDDLVLRYLGAFGPASAKDAQTWSGLSRLGEVFDRLRPRLLAYAGEDGRELFDLPDAPRPAPDVPAPVRFLYDYDNLLLSHADRRRVITEGYFAQEFRIDGPMPRVVLVDGVTAGTWTVHRERRTTTLSVQPFGPLSAAEADDVTAEAAGLARFLAPEDAHDVRLLAPS